MIGPIVEAALGLALASAVASGQRASTHAPAASQTAKTAAQRHALLMNPSSAFWSTRAPDTVLADMETSKGMVTIQLIRAWAPVGVDHFYNLARAGYYDDSRFYRVVPNFVAQFGIAGNPAIANLWARHTLRPDSVRTQNVRGTIAYAQFKPTDRTTNVFINLRDNINLDTLKFAPIGRVVQGMDVVDSLYSVYGELPMSDPPLGDPQKLYSQSNKYLDQRYPKLDRIIKITVRADTASPLR